MEKLSNILEKKYLNKAEIRKKVAKIVPIKKKNKVKYLLLILFILIISLVIYLTFNVI